MQEDVAAEDGEPASSSDEDEKEKEETDADDLAEEGGADANSSRRSRFEKKSSRLSRTVEYSDGEVPDEEQDSSERLRRLAAHRASTREVDDEMPYDFDRPIQGVTPEQQQTIDDFMGQLDGVNSTAPAMYHRFCLQVLRHYRDGGPI
jgi:hypothetical protein